jgi:hypothetical protein
MVKRSAPGQDPTMRSIAARSAINAPLPRVWEVLRDLASYPAWSPFVVAVDGSLVVGTSVVLHVAMTPGKPPLRQTERVSRFDPPGPDGAGAALSWGMVMGHPFLLRAERYQRLTALGPSETLYETADDFEGLLVPLVFALYGASIQRGFDATAAALKARCEAAAGA